MTGQLFVLTHSAGFRHSYITTAVEILTRLGESTGLFRVYATEECEELRPRGLGEGSALMFLTTGELPLTPEQKKGLIDFVKAGGGFVGVHNATDTLYGFEGYGEMLGGYFQGHPWTQEVQVIVEDRTHPSTRHLPSKFKVVEEVYTHKRWSRSGTRVLISLDNSSVDLTKGTRSDEYYALTWCHGYGHGRVFYTGFGHFNSLWREEWFQKHILGGVAWAMGED